ncbi:MAB_1171c family putative transporter [Streptomyces sp. NPDC000229]|uniref:MAB_1171c family putative transporter n=1 Tax=Streptomyces sp. NPDC000229 TaxID=3154247 RepID=UPI0033187905
MIADWAAVGQRLEILAVVVLWTVVVLRAPATIRVPRQRALWLAVATAAAAMTLSVLSGLLARRAGDSLHGLSLTTNLLGVVSASAVLDFVVTGTGSRRRYRHALYCTTVVAIGALVVLDRIAPPHSAHTIRGPDDHVPGLAYWTVLIGAHLTADAVCAVVCRRYGHESDSRLARATVYLFGMGTAFAGVFWLGKSVRLVVPADWTAAVLPYCMVLHALLRAAAIAVPLIAAARETAGRVATIWRLWPLWSDLTALVPHVVLVHRRSRLAELLRPQGPFSLLEYRKLIEIRDALLVLQPYCRPSVPGRAREYLRSVRTPGVSTEAAVLACVLHQARRAMLEGAPPRPPSASSSDFRTADLHEETSFLVQVATAYASPAVRQFEV